jgi:hypothetical protein
LGESFIILTCPISFITVNVDNKKDASKKHNEFRNNGRGLYTADLSNEVEEAALSAFIV